MYVRDLTAAMLGVILLFTISAQTLPLGDQVNSTDEPVGSLTYLLKNPGYFKVPQNRSEDEVASHEDIDENPELGEFAEGDIVAPNSRQSRNGLIKEIFRWPNGVVPYEISPSYNYREREVILQAINHYHRYTCIRFVPHRYESDYIDIVPTSRGCFSSVGRTGGRQTVNLAPNCLHRVGTPIHELMHALGFLHEHSRSDRHHYVDILYHNMDKENEHNFVKAEKDQTTSYNVGYDYESVMHYNLTAFSNNGGRTIQPIGDGVEHLAYDLIGQRTKLSDHDILKIKRMYKCNP